MTLTRRLHECVCVPVDEGCSVRSGAHSCGESGPSGALSVRCTIEEHACRSGVEILGCSRSQSYRPRGRGRCGQQTARGDSCVASHSQIIFELGLGRKGGRPARRETIRSPFQGITITPSLLRSRVPYSANVRTYSRNGPISDALVGTKQISLEQLRKVLGLESVRDLSGLIKPRPLRRSLMAGDQTRRQAPQG